MTVGQVVEDEKGNKLDKPLPTIWVEASGNLGFPEMVGDHNCSGRRRLSDQALSRRQGLLKFTNPLVIETSPGWSCLFKSPPNHFSNIRIIEGIVDTDTYHRQINFPFFGMDQSRASFL